MKPILSMRFKFAIVWAMAVGGAVVVQAAAQAQTLDVVPTFDVGDKWTYRSQNIGDRKDPYLFTSQAFKSDAGSGWLYFESGNPAHTVKRGLQRFDYKRADVIESFASDPGSSTKPGRRFYNGQAIEDALQLPLEVGKKYSVKLAWSNGSGYTDYKVEVEAYEKVKTEAGEFEAFRVNMTGFWNLTKAGADGWTGSGRSGRKVWFAPAVKRIVREESFDRDSRGSPWNQFVSELIKWEPKAQLMAALVSAPSSEKAAAPATAASQ